MSYEFLLGGGKCYSISCKGCSFPSNIHLLPQKSSSRIPSQFSRNFGLEHKQILNLAIVLSKNGINTRALPLSLELADASASASIAKPADMQVLIQTSALLLFVYIIANFVFPQFIMRTLDEEEENN